jgi:hypothetical protein
MADMVDRRLFAELEERKIEEVVLPGYCDYCDEEQHYRVRAWNGSYAVYPGQKKIEPLKNTVEPHGYFYVFLVNYLLAAKKEQPAGEWLSEKDLVGGVTFFRGPHKIPTELISEAFGNDLELLQQKCLQLGGIPLDMADCSFSFEIIGSIKIALLYWQGDEDFPAEAKLLIDSSVAGPLRLDVIYALLCDACVRIAK